MEVERIDPVIDFEAREDSRICVNLLINLSRFRRQSTRDVRAAFFALSEKEIYIYHAKRFDKFAYEASR